MELLTSIPRALGKSTYTGALGMIKLAARGLFADGAVRIWARNSYALATLTPFLSDLDLTVYFERPPGEAELRQLQLILSAAKKAFPKLGEANIYSSEDLELIGALINPWELERDPELFKLLHARGWHQKANEQDAAAFLLRMMDADLKNLIARPESRIGKWNSHFSAIHGKVGHQDLIFDPENAIDSILDLVIRLLWIDTPAERSEYHDSLKLYADISNGNLSRETLTRLASLQYPWLILFPHRFCHLHFQPRALTEPEREVLAAQIEWELFGMMAIRAACKDKAILLEHLEKLNALLRRCDANQPSDRLKRALALAGAVRRNCGEKP